MTSKNPFQKKNELSEIPDTVRLTKQQSITIQELMVEYNVNFSVVVRKLLDLGIDKFQNEQLQEKIQTVTYVGGEHRLYRRHS